LSIELIIVNLKTYKFDCTHFFDVSNGLGDISKKKHVFGKSLSGARGAKDVLTWVNIRLKFVF